MSDTTRFLSQTVDYLGFLQAKLRDLHGIATLVYELVQNADDVKDDQGQPGATRITFDVCEDVLLVENDGRFRPIDFERLRYIASGGKRAEAATSGAFGLGFLAVFQVTDAPEIFSNGKRWVIRPEAPAAERILEQDCETTGTLFRLPWAARDSAVRQILHLELVEVENLPRLTAEIGAALSLAAVFLQQLQLLEVKQNGKLVQRIVRERVEEGVLRLLQGAGETTWHVWARGLVARSSAWRSALSRARTPSETRGGSIIFRHLRPWTPACHRPQDARLRA